MSSSDGDSEHPAPESQLRKPPAQEWQLRKHLLMLATLVVSVTYVAGLNPPGGIWQENGARHRAGDPILRNTQPRWFLAFHYCNSTALAASVVVIFLLLLKNPRGGGQLALLRVVMVLDLLGLMGAYIAGSGLKQPANVYAAALVLALCSYVGVHVVQAYSSPFSSQEPAEAEPRQRTQERDDRVLLEPKERRKVLLLLATFATAITYVAGLSSPGGYWDRAESKGAYHPGDALVEVHHKGHFRMFFYCNTTAFIASLFIVVLLLDKKLSEMTVGTRSVALYVFILGALLGLLGAYAAGSCRSTDSVYVVSLIGAVLAFIFFVMMVIIAISSCRPKSADAGANQHNHTHQMVPLETSTNGGGGQTAAGNGGTVVQGSATVEAAMDEAARKVRSLILLLATLAATITYQAGLDPPGGVWPDDRDGHRAGDPVLLSAYAKRYKVFFYCNSSAFVLSLAAIIMLQQNEKLVKSHTTLLVSMMLGMFALVGAYAAGSCRDLRSSITVVAVAGTVLAYLVIQVMYFNLKYQDTNIRRLEKRLKKRHKRLLLLAVLVATVTYQAGLTPPGGFRQEDDGDHAAGDAVLLENYPRRFWAFFYCNTVSFMTSIALLLVLVNPRIYMLAIKCYALYACIVMALVGLMGAYAAGSARHVRTSIYVFALVGGVVAFIAVYTFLSRLFLLEKEKNVSSGTVAETPASPQEESPAPPQGEIPASRQEEIPAPPQGETPASPQAETPAPPRGEREARPNYREEYNSRKYLMLLGILAASVTYQAGLAPPGGVWQDDGDHGDAGDPLLRDTDGRRYRVFFYSNSTSFVASVVVIALLLQQILRPHERKNNEQLLRATKTAVVLDLVGLLVAYTAGSTRDWEHAVALAAMVLLCMAIYVTSWLWSSICKTDGHGGLIDQLDQEYVLNGQEA